MHIHNRGLKKEWQQASIFFSLVEGQMGTGQVFLDLPVLVGVCFQ